MGMSQEVRFKIAGDTTQLASSFRQSESLAEASGRRMEQTFKRASQVRQRLSPTEAKAADREYTQAKARVDAERALGAFRKKTQFEEASTSGKIRIVTAELEQLAKRRAAAEAGSTKQLELQLAIEQRLVSLRKLQREQQEANLPDAPPTDDSKRRGGMLAAGQLAFRAIGGAITFALERLINFNQSRVRVAEAQEESGASGLASLRARFAAIGGLRGQLQQGEGSLKDLERQKQFEENRANMLRTGMQGAVSLIAPEELTKSQEAVARLNAEIQRQHDANALIERDLKRQTAIRDAMLTREAKMTRGVGLRADGVRDIGGIELGPEKGSIPATARAAAAGMLNEVTRARIELDRLRKVAAAEKKFGTPESAKDARLAVRSQQNDLNIAKQQLRQRELDVRQELTGQAAEGRTGQGGRQRPLSETERLARRAQQYRERARSAVLTGAGQDAAFFMDAAIGKEATVAGRLGKASESVAQKDVSDATAIKPEIQRSNQLLEAIKESLTVVDVD